jgi:hypothetical protein
LLAGSVEAPARAVVEEKGDVVVHLGPLVGCSFFVVWWCVLCWWRGFVMCDVGLLLAREGRGE